jgi:membrane protein YdbS with pleckstrin-like domain
MKIIDKFESWTRRVYNPREAKWKRPVLFWLSITIGLLCTIAAYTQINYEWTNSGVWWVISIFSFFSLIGFIVSIFCKDYWVALILGSA